MGNKSRLYTDVMTLHNGVTGSVHPCVANFPNGEKTMFIVDCGLLQGPDEDPSNQKNTETAKKQERSSTKSAEMTECEKKGKNEKKPAKNYNRSFEFDAENIDFCLITHNHVDHTGRLPLLVKKGFRGKIYTTNPTSIMLPEALKDSCSILKGKAKAEGEPQLYGEDDVEMAMGLVEPCNYNTTIMVTPNIRVNFFPNCHLPGAAVILVRISYIEEEDINILFTGDYNNKSSFQDMVDLPQWVLDLPLTVVQESTYGDTNSYEIEPCFERNVLKAIAENKTVFAPVFSLSRAQEVLYRLKCMQDEGKLDVNVPIYLDGKLSIKYTKMYLADILELKPEMKDFLPQNFQYVEDKITRKTLIYGDNSCKIILSSSGMGSYGPARSYIPAFLGRKNVLIHFTGYTAEGTLGRKIKDTPDSVAVEVAGMSIVKQARVEYTSEFSSHAKADEMIDFLKKFTNLRLVLVNHGEVETRKIFIQRVLKEVDVEYVGNLNRDYYFKINHWGLVKTVPTKFT